MTQDAMIVLRIGLARTVGIVSIPVGASGIHSAERRFGAARSALRATGAQVIPLGTGPRVACLVVGGDDETRPEPVNTLACVIAETWGAGRATGLRGTALVAAGPVDALGGLPDGAANDLAAMICLRVNMTRRGECPTRSPRSMRRWAEVTHDADGRA
ncbi:hypothetical protein [Rhodococcus gannanensis]|uniref:Macro domain-containing protein n=1 Tax=Rhodococcus gannanensis TaxID=1960308 RepID=A0ABW4P0S7_9NOCA